MMANASVYNSQDNMEDLTAKRKLSSIVKEYRKSIAYRGVKKLRLNPYAIALLVLVIALVVLIALDLKYGWSSEIIRLTGPATGTQTNSGIQEAAQRISGILIGIPLAIVGLVIPFVVLTVSFISSKGLASLLRRYVRWLRIDWIIGVSLFVLLFLIAAVVIVNLGLSEMAAVYLTLLSLFLVVGLIVMTFHFAWEAILSLGEDRFASMLVRDVQREMHTSVQQELKYRLGINLMSELFREGALVYQWFGPRAELGEREIRAQRSGEIADINLHKLRKLRQELEQQEMTVRLTRGYGDTLEECQTVIAFVAGEAWTDEQIGVKLNACISTTRKTKGNLFAEESSALKELAIQAARENAESRFTIAFRGYMALFDSYLRYADSIKLKFSPEAAKDILAPPSVFLGLWFQLNGVIREAAENRTIESAARELYSLLQAAVKYDDFLIYHQAMSLFRAIYYHSLKHNNELGIGQPCHYLSELADHALMERAAALDSTATSMDDVRGYESYLDELAETFSHMLKTAITERDIQNFPELMTTFRELRLDRHDVTSAKADRDIVQALRTIPDRFAEKRLLIQFAAASYLLWKYNAGEVDTGTCQSLIQPLVSVFANHEQLLKCFDVVIAGTLTDSLLQNWEDHPDTRRGYWFDPYAKFILAYVVLGIRLTQAAGSIVLSASDAVRYCLDKIKQQSVSVGAQQDRWGWLISTDRLQERIDAFVEANEKCKESAIEEERQRIRNAPLCHERVEELTQGFVEKYRHFHRLLPLLEQANANAEVSKRVDELIAPGQYDVKDKKFFIDLKRTSIEHWDLDLGRGVADAEDRSIATRLLVHAATLQDDLSGTAEALDSLVAWAQQHLAQCHLLIAAPGRGTYYSLQDLGLLEPDSEDRGLSTYRDIPVTFVVIGDGDEAGEVWTIALDPSRACRIEPLEEPFIDVHLLTPEEREQVKKANPKMTNGDLDLKVAFRVGVKHKLIRIAPDEMRKVRLPI